MKANKEYFQFLRDVRFFSSLGDEEIEKLRKACREESHAAGSVVFAEGARADKFYMVVEGAVEVWKNYGEAGQDLLAVRGKGGLFGEMALVDDLPRSATLIARDPTTLLSVNRKDFQRIISEDSSFALSIMRSLSSIVRKSNEDFVNELREKNLRLEKANRELKATQKELLRAERLSALGKFSSLILHDIRSPLSVLRLNAELILSNPDDVDRVTAKAERILAEVDRLNKLANDLLDYSKGGIRLDRREVDLQEFFSSLLQHISDETSESKMVVQADAAVKRPVMIDRDRMFRVFSNLAANARKAMPEGGKLSIKAREESGSVIFEVTDTGVGMSEEMQERIFEPFFSSSGGGGTGLGMLIVKDIIEAHGGALSVQSREHKGTSLTISLPVSEKDSATTR